MNIPENILSKLTDDQKKKIEYAQTPEELLAIAKEAGQDLTPEQLEAISGGNDLCWSDCSRHEICPVECRAV